MKLFTILCLTISALSLLPHSESANILAMFVFPGPSQYILVQPYLKTLAARGHEVTVISAFPQKEKIPNFRDIAVPEIFDSITEDMKAEMMNPVKPNKWQQLNLFSDFLCDLPLRVLRNEEVQRLLRSTEEHFDLIITETLQTDALYGFAQHFNAPLIGVSSFGTEHHIDELVGNVSPAAYTPLVTSGFTDRMNFKQRLQNLALKTIESIHNHMVHLPKQVKLYKEFFPKATADLLDIRKNFSLMLLNQHFTLSFSRPYVPNMIEVGGFHLNHKPKPLPKDMETFLNASTEDVIYFSMGTNVLSKDLPQEKLQLLMKIFASLKQNVMWKFENTDLPGKPKNVFISKWFPQPDILAHPKVKVFFTHGGLLSTIEAIYHGKPVVGMPVFYDQFLNVERAKKAGFGLKVDFYHINETDLKAALMEILNNRKYANVAAKMSQLYHDQPMQPLDTAIYWTEYVLRHKGAPHMRVASQQMSFIAKNSLDTIAVLYGAPILLICIMIFVVCKLIGLVFSKKSRKHLKQKQT